MANEYDIFESESIFKTFLLVIRETKETKQLLKKTGLTKGTLSGQLKQLNIVGLIEVKAHPKSGRKKCYSFAKEKVANGFAKWFIQKYKKEKEERWKMIQNFKGIPLLEGVAAAYKNMRPKIQENIIDSITKYFNSKEGSKEFLQLFKKAINSKKNKNLGDIYLSIIQWYAEIWPAITKEQAGKDGKDELLDAKLLTCSGAVSTVGIVGEDVLKTLLSPKV